jgi:hypothetical protein
LKFSLINYKSKRVCNKLYAAIFRHTRYTQIDQIV